VKITVKFWKMTVLLALFPRIARIRALGTVNNSELAVNFFCTAP
jgi:hypothetical protein